MLNAIATTEPTGSLSELIDRARFAEQSGEWDEALGSYRIAIARIQAGEETERGPQVLRWIGRVYFERGDYAEAHNAFETALVTAQKLGQRDHAAGAMNGMAAVEQFRGRLEVAEALYMRAGVLAREVGNYRLAATIDMNLGTLANIRGDLGTALVRYQSALERFRELKDERHCSAVLTNMGILHKDVGEWVAAELCFTSALELATRADDRTTMAKVENNSAELYLKRQNYERARECCERAFKIYSQLGSDAGLGQVHKFYGILYRETGKPQVAHVQLSLSLRLAKTCENPLLEAETESERAQLFLNQKQVAPALQSLNRAHRIFTELDARREILDLRRRLDRLENTYLQAVKMLADDQPVANQDSGSRRGTRVAELASMLAEACGHTDLAWLRIGAYLRDVGNRSIPSEVLDKPGPLTADEWVIVKKHTILGDELVKQLEFPDDVRPIIRGHHEHWDGTGYPDGLAGENIPLAARILCIADVYDALTSPRSFRGAFSSAQALEIMQGESGKIFDPRLFTQFLRLIQNGAPRVAAVVEEDHLRAAI